MATVPDDIDTAHADDCDRAQAIVVLDLNKRDTVSVASELAETLAQRSHLVFTTALAARKVGTAIQLDLVSERAGVVGPALDALCAFLRTQPGDARIRVPGWQRAFYGWERAIWTSEGRIRAGAT